MSLRKRIDSILKGFEQEFDTHNRIEVSRSALLHNLAIFREISGGEAIIPVLKGNAYGHGIEVVARALAGQDVPYVAVDGYFEALRVREVSRQLVLIMGAIKPANFPRMKYDGFAFVVQDEAAIKALGSIGKKINVHLECNTGMNRYGAKLTEVPRLTQLILAYHNLNLEGVMSHLADADGDDPTTVEAAEDLFDSCVEAVRKAGGQPTLFHVAQTAGSTRSRSGYSNAMRLGIGLYGLNPFAPKHPMHDRLGGLRPALKLVSTITKVTELQAGEQVSYNYTFTALKPMRIGVLPLGYYEGLNRALSSVGVVKVGASYTPVAGRICMNHTMISLEGIDAQVGDEVVVYSDDPNDRNSIDRIAAEQRLFNYSLLTGLSHDVRRILVP